MERKVKYDYAFKLECVKLIIEQSHSCESASAQKGVHESIIRKWLMFYNAYGLDGLLPRKNRDYSIDFKLKVLKTISEQNLSLHQAYVKFNIPTRSIIAKWQRDFANFGVKGLESKPKGRTKSMDNFKRKKRKSDKPLTREEELLIENEALRCENALLKKLQALIQAEEEAKKRKL
jgi:transposase